MKRTILLAVLCMVCTIGLFAQKEKVVRIHKTDGTVVEYHAAAIRDFSFSGKAIVNDGDYTEKLLLKSIVSMSSSSRYVATTLL